MTWYHQHHQHVILSCFCHHILRCSHLLLLSTAIIYANLAFISICGILHPICHLRAGSEIFRRASTSKKWSLNDEMNDDLMNFPWALRFSDCEAWSVHLIFPHALVTRVRYTTLLLQRSMGGTAVTIWHEVEFVRLPLFKRYICE